MGGFLSSIMERWGKFYRRSSIQVILSLSFTAVSVAALTIYDMCKAVQKDMRITNIRLLEKSGGKSGDYTAEE